MLKINYIVVTFIGARRNRSYGLDTLIDRHLQFLQKNNSEIAQVTVVVNCEKKEDIPFVKSLERSYDGYYTGLEFVARPNNGYSYGAWNDVINFRLDHDHDFTHYFIFEDDYVPHRADFIEIFLSQMTDNVGYVWGASHPSGLVSAEVARDVKNRYGSVFKIDEEVVNYTYAEHTQRTFTDYYFEAGYEVGDIAKVVSDPYYEKFSNEQKGRIIEYGVPDVPPAVVPIFRDKLVRNDPNRGIQYDISLLK